MPRTEIIFYQESDDAEPVLEWLQDLRKENRKAFAKVVGRIQRLGELGFELRRPEADLLQDGIYELRAKFGRVNYRVLYFFHGQNVAVLAHALTKTDKVPQTDIERAVQRKRAFQRDPDRHSYRENELSNGQIS